MHLICGLPASGKTTLAKQLENSCNAVRFAPDEWLYRLGLDFYDEASRAKIEGLQWEIAQQLLRNGTDVVLENGFWSKAERDSFRAIARSIGAKTKSYFLDVPITELKARLIERNRTRDASTPPVDPLRLDEWVTVFEPLTDDEIAEEVFFARLYP